MPLMVNEGNAIEAIIPFDSPKHPRLPANRFPGGGRAGALTQAARVAWISGKYLYKYHKKWLASGFGLALSTSLFARSPQNGHGPVSKRFNARQ